MTPNFSRYPEELKAWVAHLHDKRTQVVLSGGVFDLFHFGHVQYLRRAESFGVLHVVAVNSDLSTECIRGRKPFIPEQERAGIVAALKCVSAVILFDEASPCELIKFLRPAVFAKGDEYAGKQLAERDAMAEWGGRVVLLPTFPQRTSSIVAKIRGT